MYFQIIIEYFGFLEGLKRSDGRLGEEDYENEEMSHYYSNN